MIENSYTLSKNNKKSTVLPRLSILLSLIVALSLSGCNSSDIQQGPEINVFLESDPSGRPVEVPVVGESISIGFNGMPKGQQIEVFLNDDLGKEWSYARMTVDQEGVVKPFVFWYHSGVIGVTSLPIEFKPDPSFKTFEEAETYFADHPLTLLVKDLQGKIIAKRNWKLAPRRLPMVYPSNADGILMNSIHAVDEHVFVTGRNFPAGKVVHLALVDNQHQWNTGDPVQDISGTDRTVDIKKIILAPGQTQFTIPVWDKALSRPGSYDVVARIGSGFENAKLLADDILSYGADTGIVLYTIINGNIVFDVAGRMKSAPAKFEFSDSFEKGEDVYGAVDPTDVPALHMGGNYAAYYVVNNQDEVYWDAVNPILVDVSGGYEIQRVKYWCINASRRLIWPNATQPSAIAGYDVVVDFGSTAAMNAADFTADNTYNKGTDFLDGYQDTGFYLFEDPSAIGGFAVGNVELDEANGITGMPFDPMGMNGPNYIVDLAWGYIMYPATAAGTGQPLSNAETNYPVALFLHGRHQNCDSNGAAADGMASYQPPGGCIDANRIPSHRGYDYIMERLASQGIISVSIDAFEIQQDNGDWNYDLRGRLVLKWLDKLRDWNVNGTDPFGGIFNGKIDMSRVAISGHSRGGEGVVAAQHLNKTWPVPHSILAVNAIAPTDQNNLIFPGGTGPSGIYYPMTDSAYYATIGARDGDIWDYHGIRFYDRAYPEGMVDRKNKSIAFIYGANHNFFNTVWTPAVDLGLPNPWAGTWNDGSNSGFQMNAIDQRVIARTTIAAFFRWHLHDLEPYKEIFTGRLKPSAIDNSQIHWSYQDSMRLALDDFEQLPQNVSLNSQGGMNSNAGFSQFDERLFNYYRSSYDPTPPITNWLFHDTLGTKLSWAANATLTLEFPGGVDATPYSHLTLRAGKYLTDRFTQVPDVGVDLRINIEDNLNNTALWNLRSEQFDDIPTPYWQGYYLFTMNSLRIPLKNFTMNNSGVNLANIERLTIEATSDGEVVIDDIEFGR